jgi:hypothetical protein
MTARRRSTATAVAVAAGLTALTAAALAGCDPADAPAAAGTTTAPATPAGGGRPSSPAAGPSTATTPPTTAAPASGGGTATAAPVANGTAGNGLTISDGSRWVVMNGTRVDFGTQVWDLSWSPDGTRAAFVDGAGDLVVSRPDGGGRVVVARHTGAAAWSHPTWQVAKADEADGLPAKDNLIFASGAGASAVLETVPATAVDGTPKRLPLGGYSGPGTHVPPQSGNSWPDAAGSAGTSVYENAAGEVYIRDDNLRQQGGALAAGSQPALAPGDEDSVVFVRSVAGHDHLMLSTDGDDGKRTVTDLTPGATTDYTAPAFSPDGSTVAARVPGGIATVPVRGGAPVRVSGYPGTPAYRG